MNQFSKNELLPCLSCYGEGGGNCEGCGGKGDLLQTLTLEKRIERLETFITEHVFFRKETEHVD